jgi:hypothetical protein
MTTSTMRDLAATVLDPETGPAEFRGTAQELAAQVLAAPVSVLRVSVRTLYGVNYLHPENTAADLFAALLHVKNFNAIQVSAIRQLGYEFHVAAGELPREFQPRETISRDRAGHALSCPRDHESGTECPVVTENRL